MLSYDDLYLIHLRWGIFMLDAFGSRERRQCTALQMAPCKIAPMHIAATRSRSRHALAYTQHDLNYIQCFFVWLNLNVCELYIERNHMMRLHRQSCMVMRQDPLIRVGMWPNVTAPSYSTHIYKTALPLALVPRRRRRRRLLPRWSLPIVIRLRPPLALR